MNRTLSNTSLALLFPVFLPACSYSETTTIASCDVTIGGIKPQEAYTGDSAVLSGRLFTDAYDTAVYVGTHRATVLEVNRYECGECDDCLDENSCNPCDDCDTCDPYCKACVELVFFDVPYMNSGETTVRLFNRHGESNWLDFIVREEVSISETGQPDSAGYETAIPDSGQESGNPAHDDTSALDSARPETANSDTSTVDTGIRDTSHPDTDR